jgi:GntR family transcriptional repressor for pyruvate dehydrogenase complex
MDVKPIVTKRVYQEIISQFVEMIRTDRIKAGEKLPAERILAEMFQVSRPSVREALRAMETIGMVEIRAGGGAYVTDINLAPFFNTFAPLLTKHENFELELLDLRELLEIRSAELAAEHCTPEIADYLEEPILRMEASIQSGDGAEGLAGDLLFHKRISEKSGNYILKKASEFVNSLLEISIKGGRALVLQNKGNVSLLYKEHRNIFDAIKANDPAGARESMSRHLMNVKEIYQKNL